MAVPASRGYMQEAYKYCWKGLEEWLPTLISTMRSLNIGKSKEIFLSKTKGPSKK
jgi:hypothetical protein